MRYVDGFVMPILKKNLAPYRRLAALAGRVWRRHGALDYCECAADDMAPKTSFPRQLKLKPGETVVFAWITYRSRAHRDRVNAKVMKDPRILAQMMKPMPFDVKRLLMAGFKSIVEA